MDIDENDKAAKDAEAPAAKTTTATKPKKNAPGTPSASSESASVHPDMSLAQDIHRLTMIHAGKLSVDDATAIIGCKPEELLERVMRRVGTGGKSVEDAMSENERKYKPSGGEGGEKGDAAEKKDAKKSTTDKEEAGEALLNPSLYRHLRSTLSYSSPDALKDDDLEALESHHETILKHLNDAVTKAREEAGDMEVLRAHVDIARYSARCSAKEPALEAYEAVLALPKLSVGKKLDAHLELARVSSFWGDHRKTKATLDAAAAVIANGGDWDRRNRLKAYRALSLLLARDAEAASGLLAEGIATFSCAELCGYPEFITYAIVTNLLYLKRTELKKSIIDGSEVLQVAKEIPVVIRLANTLYDCDYKAYLHALVDLQPHLIADRYLQPHAGYFLRELHVLALRQFLDSYQSVTLESMAKSFGVGTEFLDVQLSRFIAAGRLTAKIDKYGGVVETNRPDWKNARYQEMIQKGDLLLNRIQKLGRVVDL
eukprot:CAMPEP_0172575622 /NCGR_PEP_ID=MMETSP1067-20121228/137303_1 /TAXON_ID=265564 ORGANISM="Thalassiosira punctigera, Strain Tpunct2005C2" /NCGR_SAMPLE_ID=MMETSP1067 /ASSEMBLY_ACC=CAM_ASM_000444 /LENGTH=485 /DNA_ID=CAMNT_0013368273 /DNA_START=126 /DNA_END=1583 /DNA_ORIENTATION=+